MTLTVERSEISGVIDAPPSKSYTHRALIMSALAKKGRITNPLLSADTLATLEALELFGAEFTPIKNGYRVETEELSAPPDVIDVKNSGTTLRLLSGLAGLLPGTTIFTGDASIRRRPMGPLLSALSTLGADAFSSRDNGCAPVVITGPMRGGTVTIRGDVSSQFISSLLIAAPLAGKSTQITVTNEMFSEPYVEVTLEMLEGFGVKWERRENSFKTGGGEKYRENPFRVPGDFSSAAFPLAAAAITGGRVKVLGVDNGLAQGDKAIIQHLRKFGAMVKLGRGSVEVNGGDLTGCDLDLKATPDLFPILCVVAASAKGTSTLSGAAHLRLKESDRIKAMAEGLSRMGASAVELPDGLRIDGGSPLRGAKINTYGDHRIAMAFAIAGLVSSGRVVIDDESSAAVSYPGFVTHLQRLGAKAVVRE
ncbi:MAG: 3-phosphoshikimate 1-carboxyvinyltransferase [Euryarchaeota archaeon]|nr:3-phosphoshikimate 1-carboxyvinyltransferase [Euryarchaeota archaeon]